MKTHTYITGNKFQNIYGGSTPCYYGYITHITELTPLMKQRWPWMKGLWQLYDGKFTHGNFDTLREAKNYAKELWPTCEFKTRTQILKES